MRRHDLVWIDPHAPWAALCSDAQPRLQAWLDARLPLVVARRDPAVDGDQLRLGVPLPPSEGRLRLALRVVPSYVEQHREPLFLDEVIAAVSAPWRAPLQALQASCRTLPTSPRVFGSFAWQALTGLPYVHTGSDLDLLWHIDELQQATMICQTLQHWEQQHGMRADGELRLPAGHAVNWREYASDARELLVKGEQGCWLSPRHELLHSRSAA